MIASGVLLKQLSIRQDEKIIKDVALAAMEIFGTLIALFVGVGLVNKEIDRRSLYPLLSKPLGRSEFLAGKFAGLAFTVLVNVAIMAVGLYATLVLSGHRADPGLLKAVVAIYLGLLLVVSLALLFSCLTSTILATLCTFGLVVAGRYADVVRNAADVVASLPSWLPRALYYALPNFQNFNLKDRVVYGDPVSWAEVGWLVVYAAVYGGFALAAAMAAFAKRDLR
jgi:ABC-type transport system involved in multi-copper enzyme maturation permease subunit